MREDEDQVACLIQQVGMNRHYARSQEEVT